MATESSAVVRFINLVQKDHKPIYSEGIRETSVELRPKSSKATKIAVGVALVAGAAIAGGFAIGRGYFDGSSSSSLRATSTPAPSVVPGAQLPSTSAAPAPTSAQLSTPPAPPTPAPVATPLVTVPPDILAETGFDIRVSPPGRVSVDAQLLGTAPLRIRNLQPGAHVIEVEAPAGYFSRRLEVELVAGDPQQVKIQLDAIEDDGVAATAGAPEKAPVEAAPARKESKKEKKAAREAAKKTARAEKAAARAEAKRIAKERAELKREAARDEKERRDREARDAKEAKVARAAATQPAADDDLEAAMSAVTGAEGGARKAAPKVAALAPEAPAEASGAPGTLMLGSKPLCDIYVDGKATGLKTPQRSMELAAGSYKIKLVNAELGIEKTFKVKIAPGKTTRAIQDLTK